MRALIIGGNGFLGSSFILYLMNKHPNWEIINYSRSEKIGSLNHLRNLENNSNYKFVKGDLKDTLLLEKLVQEADYIFNSVGESNIRDFVERPVESINSGLAGIVSLLGTARKSKAKKIIIMTSWEVYGDKCGKIANEVDGLNPENIYAATNAAIENVAMGYYRSYNVPVISIRSCNIFGPRQTTDKIVSRTITDTINNKKITLFGDGSEVRAYLYVEDFCRAVDLLIKKGKEGEIYNIGSKDLISNLNLVKIILNKLGKGGEKIEFLSDKKTDNRRIILGLEKIKGLGWDPETTLEGGIEKTIEWYKNKLFNPSS